MPTDYPVHDVMDRYCFYRQKYVMMTPEFVRHMPYAYTSKQVWEHLNGNIALCVFAGPSNTSFLSVDVDMRDPAVVHRVVDTIAELGIPRDLIYISESGGKGYHVDIFFSESIYNWKAKELYGLIIYFGGLDARKVEYRPTAGQAIKLPMGIHPKTGKRCWFVDRETLEPIESFDYIKQTAKLDVSLIDGILREGNYRRFNELLRESKERILPEITKQAKTREYTEIRIEEEGTRQRRMLEKALQLYRAGCGYEQIHDGLCEWLGRQDATKYKDTPEECMRNIDNITAWVMKHGLRVESAGEPVIPDRCDARIYRSDIERILQGPTKAARLLAFLITVYCDRYGFCGLGAERLCEETALKSRKTVVTAATALAEAGIFDRRQGGYRNVKNTLMPITNKYRFPEGYERGGAYYRITRLLTPENIYETYIRVAAALCSDDELRKRMTKPELADVQKARKDDKSGAFGGSVPE